MYSQQKPYCVKKSLISFEISYLVSSLHKLNQKQNIVHIQIQDIEGGWKDLHQCLQSTHIGDPMV